MTVKVWLSPATSVIIPLSTPTASRRRSGNETQVLDQRGGGRAHGVARPGARDVHRGSLGRRAPGAGRCPPRSTRTRRPPRPAGTRPPETSGVTSAAGSGTVSTPRAPTVTGRVALARHRATGVGAPPPNGEPCRPLARRVVVHDQRGHPVPRLHGDERVGVDAPQHVPERLADAVAVDGGPGDHRPVVVELPHDRAGVVREQAAEVLDPVPDGTGLVELADPVPLVDASPPRQVVTEAALQLEVAVGGLLVHEHLRAVRVERLVSCTTDVSVDQAGGPWKPNSAADRGTWSR